MSGFTSPNYTQTPNDLFDSLMKSMGDAELRVILVAIRKTLGFHKQFEAISISQFMDMSGLTRQGAINGIQAAIEDGLLHEVGTGKRGVKLYELVIRVDQSTALTSEADDQSTALTGTGQRRRHTKEKQKEKAEEKENIAPDGAAGASPSPFGKPIKPDAPIFDKARVYDCVAFTTFGIKDMRDLRPTVVEGKEKKNPAGARIGIISTWLKKFYLVNGKPEEERAAAEKEVAEKVAAFYKAWSKRRNYSIPRDASKFADEWIAWTQEALPAPKLDESTGGLKTRGLLPGADVKRGE